MAEDILDWACPGTIYSLELNGKATVDDMLMVYQKLTEDMDFTDMILDLKSPVLLMKGDEVIRQNFKELKAKGERIGLSFYDNWDSPESDYRKLSSIARGSRYKMVERDGRWAYTPA